VGHVPAPEEPLQQLCADLRRLRTQAGGPSLRLFPGGQLFADLRGFSPGAQPRDPADVLRGFLVALGVDAERIPLDPEDRAALFRSLVADRRMLVVLDNARDSDQVVPLLPGGAACTVLITSGRRLNHLVTVHGARSLTVDALSHADARDLLAARLGTDRLSAEPGAVATLLACCAGLPLALGVIAGRAQVYPPSPLAAELEDAGTRLGVLADSDPVVSLPAVLSWSYSRLPAGQARLFGLLGLAPGPDLDLPAVANLAGTSPMDAAALLRGLAEAHLVDQHRPGRYRMHDLVKLYAADRADGDLRAADRLEGLRRLLDFLLHTARTADRLLAPHHTQVVPFRLTSPATPLALPDVAAALAWLKGEHAGLLAAQRLAVEHGFHRHAWQLAWCLENFHLRCGLLHDMVASWKAGLAAVRHERDPAVLSLVHRCIGDSYALIGRHADAIQHLNEALMMAESARDPLAQAISHYYLAMAWTRHHDHHRALEHASTALHFYRDLDEPLHEAELYNTVGWIYTVLGRYEEAATNLEAALACAASTTR
jgi:tetratricopeptide (TPR) repeat protein